MKYTNVVFDLYGTLVDIWTDENRMMLWNTLAWQFCLHQASYRPKELKKAYQEFVKEEERRIREMMGPFAEIDLKRVFVKLFEHKGVHVSGQTVEEMMLSFRALSIKRLQLYEGAIDLLTELKAAGKKVFLLTNAQRIFTEREIVFLGLYDYFDGILYSSDQKVKKPGALFYQKLVEMHHLELKQTVMIGNDALCDVKGALNAGLSAIFLESNIKTDEKCPDGVLKFRVEELDMLKKELVQKC